MSLQVISSSFLSNAELYFVEWMYHNLFISKTRDIWVISSLGNFK